MALSDKEISALYFEALGSQHLREQDRKMVTRFAHAVESEVRKSDEALIRQLTDLVQAQHDYIMALPADVVASLPAMPGFDGDWADTIKAAARERLGGQHGTE